MKQSLSNDTKVKPITEKTTVTGIGIEWDTGFLVPQRIV